MLAGGCHCGTLTIQLETACAPSDLPVRICGCSFCRKHRPRYTSDPAGRVTIRAAREAALVRYRFGLALADFLICGTCGVFVAAYEPGTPGRAVVNLDVLARAAELTAAPAPFTAYDSEDVATRTARRAKGWTPASLVIDADDDATSRLAHELRTPLNAVLGLTDLLLLAGGDPLTARQRQYLDGIAESGRQLLARVQDVLERAKADADAREHRP